MKSKFLKVALDRHFFDTHQTVLVAVSGGLDSMNLLQLLMAVQDTLDITIGLAHVHHGQRPESDQEAAYLETFAKNHGLAFHLSYFTGAFSEEKARTFRYAFFKETMESHHYTALVTAHHADDQAETVLMRLIRGSRLRHLSGIPERQVFGPGELIRPLLSFKKSELQPLFHFEDTSNQSTDYFRNRIRNDYIPRLSHENPKFSQHLGSLADEVATVNQALAYFIEGKDYRQLDQYLTLPDAVQTMVLQHCLSDFPELQVSKPQFDTLRHLLNVQRNKVIPIKDDYVLDITYTRFSIQKINPQTDEEWEPIMIQSGNLVTINAFQISFNTEIENPDQVIYLETDRPVYLRRRIEGDKIRINGHDRKIRRYFIDHKVDHNERKNAVIICQEEKILGIAGNVVSDLSKWPKNDTINNALYIKKIK